MTASRGSAEDLSGRQQGRRIGHHTESAVVPLDAATGGMREVGAQKQVVRTGQLREQTVAGVLCLDGIDVADGADLGVGQLYGMMHAVAADQRAAVGACQSNRQVAGSVAACRHQTDAVGHLDA